MTNSTDKEARHAFVAYKTTPYCGVKINYGARCGLAQNDPVHLSDDVESDRRVPFVGSTDKEEAPAERVFVDHLPLESVRLAPGEYAIRDRKGRTLWTMNGAALADWVCASVNGYDAALAAIARDDGLADHTQRLVDLFTKKAIELHKTPGAFTNQLAFVAAQYVNSLASPTQDGLTDPRDMTDDELRAEIKAHESRLYSLKCECAKVWRMRLRMGHATEADHARLAEFNKRRANKESQPL